MQVSTQSLSKGAPDAISPVIPGSAGMICEGMLFTTAAILPIIVEIAALPLRLAQGAACDDGKERDCAGIPLLFGHI